MDEQETPSTTETIYARVPVPLKEAVQAYADTHGKTLAGAVSELLSRGLGIAPDRPMESAIACLIAVSTVTSLTHPLLMKPDDLRWRVSETTKQISEVMSRIREDIGV